MNSTRFALALTGATLLLAPLAGAQQTWVELTGPGSLTSGPLVSPANGIYYISPYAGSIAPTQGQLPAGGTPVNLNCVDFFHDVTVGEQWKANVTSLGAAAANPSTAATTLQFTRFDNLAVYEQAAWLTTQYAGDGNDATEADAIQTAIWWLAADAGSTANPTYGSSNIFEGPAPTAPEGTLAAANALSVSTTQHWIDLASYEYTQQASGYYNQFEILTDANASFTTCFTDPINRSGPYRCDQTAGTAQEFIIQVTPTPEPGTLALGATGLFAVFGYGVFTRRKKAAYPRV